MLIFANGNMLRGKNTSEGLRVRRCTCVYAYVYVYMYMHICECVHQPSVRATVLKSH